MFDNSPHYEPGCDVPRPVREMVMGYVTENGHFLCRGCEFDCPMETKPVIVTEQELEMESWETPCEKCGRVPAPVPRGR